MHWRTPKYLFRLLLAALSVTPAAAQNDTLALSVEQLFERGLRYNLQLQADAIEEEVALEQTRTPPVPTPPTGRRTTPSTSTSPSTPAAGSATRSARASFSTPWPRFARKATSRPSS